MVGRDQYGYIKGPYYMVKPGPMPPGGHNKVESKKLYKSGRFPKLRAAGKAFSKPRSRIYHALEKPQGRPDILPLSQPNQCQNHCCRAHNTTPKSANSNCTQSVIAKVVLLKRTDVHHPLSCIHSLFIPKISEQPISSQAAAQTITNAM